MEGKKEPGWAHSGLPGSLPGSAALLGFCSLLCHLFGVFSRLALVEELPQRIKKRINIFLCNYSCGAGLRVVQRSRKAWLFTHARNLPADTRLFVRQSEKPATSPCNLMNHWFKRASKARASVTLRHAHPFLNETAKLTEQWKQWKGTGRTNWLTVHCWSRTFTFRDELPRAGLSLHYWHIWPCPEGSPCPNRDL